jgi:aspartate aminotransferase
VTAANVLATMGGQEGLQLVFSLMRGGTCAGFTPAWSCVFDNIFPFTQTTFIPVPLLADKGWAIDFARLEKVLKGVDSFYFNSPHNPTGRVFTAEEIERVHGLCKKNNVLMIADEAYRELVYEGTHISPLTLDRDGGVVSVNTFSKSLAVTGLRVGYTVCRDKGLIEMLAKGEYTQTAGVPMPFQHAFAKAMSHPELPAWMKQYRASMTDRRAALVAGLDPSLRASAPQGAFYCFVDLRDEQSGLSQVEATAQAEQLAVDLLTTAGVAVVPGSAFGSDFAGYARLSYSTLSPAAITDGARRLGRAISEARGRRTGVAAAR